jgi:hypothetical protein
VSNLRPAQIVPLRRRNYCGGDLLTTMLHRGTITAPMREAGLQLRSLFHAAQADKLSVRDLARPAGCMPRYSPTATVSTARALLSRALDRAGDPGRLCLLSVVCCENSLKEFGAQGWRGRPIAQEAASGMLVGALSALVAHFDEAQAA